MFKICKLKLLCSVIVGHQHRYTKRRADDARVRSIVGRFFVMVSRRAVPAALYINNVVQKKRRTACSTSSELRSWELPLQKRYSDTTIPRYPAWRSTLCHLVAKFLKFSRFQLTRKSIRFSINNMSGLKCRGLHKVRCKGTKSFVLRKGKWGKYICSKEKSVCSKEFGI